MLKQKMEILDRFCQLRRKYPLSDRAQLRLIFLMLEIESLKMRRRALL